jgi:hypothetical protein
MTADLQHWIYGRNCSLFLVRCSFLDGQRSRTIMLLELTSIPGLLMYVSLNSFIEELLYSFWDDLSLIRK